MVLTIFCVSSLAFEIPSMEALSFCMASWASMTKFLASVMSPSAWVALSALRWVVEDISSSEDDVCSMAAACSDAPSAKEWLAAEISLEAAETSFAAVFSPLLTRFRGPVMLRMTP